MAQKPEPRFKIAAENRKARYEFEIGEKLEAGLVLTGTEVKSLRTGKATIAESYVGVTKAGEVQLINANIPEYLQANRFNHEPKRPRTLLLKQREIAKLAQGIEREGMTIVPLKLYFNERGRAKLEIALGRGKKLHDKRETEKQRDWGREKARLLREDPEAAALRVRIEKLYRELDRVVSSRPTVTRLEADLARLEKALKTQGTTATPAPPAGKAKP